MTLHIQKALWGGETPASLKEKLAINFYEHPEHPLLGFKYDQLNSPRTDPIVCEARGLVLEKDTWKVIAKPFNRFFNLGEDQENFKNFDWSNFTSTEKADGSLIIVYNYANSWHINTSGSFALGIVNFSEKTWKELFLDSAKLDFNQLDSNHTYLFELCTIYNKVIRIYSKPTVYLLSVINNQTTKEVEETTLNSLATSLNIVRPEVFSFSGAKEIEDYLTLRIEKDPTFEGLVIKDKNNLRYKIKTKTYLSLHHMKDNGNLFNPKRLVPWVLKDDPAELLVYFPETKEALEETKHKIDQEWAKLKSVWEQFYRIENQKEFALAIKDKSSFGGLLFVLRKQKGKSQTEGDLLALWRDSGESIIKNLF